MRLSREVRGDSIASGSTRARFRAAKRTILATVRATIRLPARIYPRREARVECHAREVTSSCEAYPERVLARHCREAAPRLARSHASIRFGSSTRP